MNVSGNDITLPFGRVDNSGVRTSIARAVASETPIALEFNGIGYAVLMATPKDVPDLVTGFALSERLIDAPEDVEGSDIHEAPQGLLVRCQLNERTAHRIIERVRHRVAESSCGLCGIENLEQAVRPLRHVGQQSSAGHDAIFRAVTMIGALQPMNSATGAMHAAALCSREGTVVLVREDIGRHNAFDKLIGAMRTTGRDWDGGFALLSSRCSYELVEKAALADCPLLVTMSAPTSFAISRAKEAGVRLICLARNDSFLVAP